MTASHILVKDEATCKDLKAKIEKGASFEEVNMIDASELIKGLFSFLTRMSCCLGCQKQLYLSLWQEWGQTRFIQSWIYGQGI